MTEITYTSKAKNDLAHIHWHQRHKIISRLAKFYGKNPKRNGFENITGSEYLKLKYENHVIVGSIQSQKLQIITVQKQLALKSS